MRRIAIVTVALAIACGDSATEPTFASVAGTWNLQTINASPLPFAISGSGTNKIEVTSSTITLFATGTFKLLTASRTTSGTSVTNSTQTDAGIYTLAGTTITFTFNSDGSTGTAKLTEQTMTRTLGGAFTYVYALAQ